MSIHLSQNMIEVLIDGKYGAIGDDPTGCLIVQEAEYWTAALALLKMGLIEHSPWWKFWQPAWVITDEGLKVLGEQESQKASD